MNKKNLYKFIIVGILLTMAVSIVPSGVVHAKKWTYKAWVERKREKDRHFAEVARKRPNVYKDMVNNAAKQIIGASNVGGGEGQFNAWNYTHNELLNGTAGFLSRGAEDDTTALGMLRGVGEDGVPIWLQDSDGDFFRAQGNNFDLTVYKSQNGVGSLCIGWGCLVGNIPPGGGGGGGQACNATAPSGSLDLVSPGDRTEVEAESGKVTLDWEDFSAWGACCGACSRTFQVFMGKEGANLVRVGSTDESTSTASVNVEVEETYNWYVIALNSDTGMVRSPTWSFTVLPGAQTVTGYIWDSTGLVCTADKDSNEIQTDDVDGNVAVSVGATSGTWDPSFSGYSYEIEDVPYGPGQILCANVPEPVDKPNFRYALTCVDNDASGLVSGSCATIDVLGPTSRDLGFRLTSTGWFQSIGGDVFGGCDEASCAESVSVGIPEAADILGGFARALVADVGSLFGDSGFSITDNAYSEDDNRHLEFMASENPWPRSFVFSPAEGTPEVSDCDGMFSGDLDGGSIYSADVSCVQDGLDNLSGNYSLGSDGVAAVYVSGTDALMFEKEFASSSSDQRVLFILEGPVEYGTEFGVVAPTSTTSAQVQAGIISESSIVFAGKSGADLGTDTTIIVEGPIVSKDGSISFDRDRGLDNGYPAEVVKYNPIYLTDAPEGIQGVDISWVIEN